MLDVEERGAITITRRQLQGPARDRIEAHSRIDDDTVTAIWAAPGTQAAIDGFLHSLK